MTIDLGRENLAFRADSFTGLTGRQHCVLFVVVIKHEKIKNEYSAKVEHAYDF